MAQTNLSEDSLVNGTIMPQKNTQQNIILNKSKFKDYNLVIFDF
jgi:hypothetical protein